MLTLIILGCPDIFINAKKRGVMVLQIGFSLFLWIFIQYSVLLEE